MRLTGGKWKQRPGGARFAAAACLLAFLPDAARAEWIAGWTAAPFPAIRKLVDRDERSFEDQTVRQFVRVAASGERLRLRLTNELGASPIDLAEGRVAIADAAGRSKPGSDRLARFDGRSEGRIAAGAPRLSDPIPLSVRAGETLTISVYYRSPATPAAHLLEVQLAPGNQAAAPLPSGARPVRAPALAAAVEIWRPAPARGRCVRGQKPARECPAPHRCAAAPALRGRCHWPAGAGSARWIAR